MLAFLAAGVAVAQAQTNTYSSCTNSYQSGTLAPTGYGSAYDKVFGGLDVSVDCNGNTVTVGNGKANQYVYKNAYVYTTNGWQVLNLTSPATLQSNNWYAAQATASLGGVDLTQTTYVVGYTCD